MTSVEAQPPVRSWRTLARHQAASIVTTLVDFTVMTLLVQIARIDPVPATACGAACGAVTNFTLGRRWTFRAPDEIPAAAPWHGQAWRYAVVSLASLGWNTLGEHVFVHILGVQYLAARAVVGLTVSLLWNYPMQRRFVFGALGTKKTP